MTPEEETLILMNAYIDGELSPSETLDIERRMAVDANLQALYEELLAVSAGIRSALSQVSVPTGLADRIMTRTAGITENDRSSAGLTPHKVKRPVASFQWGAMAACLLVGLVAGAGASRIALPSGGAHATSTTDMIFAAHLRGLAATQPFDIASSDRHVVKPWFNGRTTIAPAAPDLSASGFTLLGGRVDIAGDMTVPTLVYQLRRHIISVTVLPEGEPVTPSEEKRDGTTIERWAIGNLTYMAVSDLNVTDLRQFVERFTDAAR